LCKDTNGKFVLCGLQDNVQKLVQIAQLDKVLSISSDQKEAQDLIHQ
jgi:anti-anti-sigma regulatory factor